MPAVLRPISIFGVSQNTLCIVANLPLSAHRTIRREMALVYRSQTLQSCWYYPVTRGPIDAIAARRRRAKCGNFSG
jgi:hypothetical protein